jgi:hypothetical protein
VYNNIGHYEKACMSKRNGSIPVMMLASMANDERASYWEENAGLKNHTEL